MVTVQQFTSFQPDIKAYIDITNVCIPWCCFSLYNKFCIISMTCKYRECEPHALDIFDRMVTILQVKPWVKYILHGKLCVGIKRNTA